MEILSLVQSFFRDEAPIGPGGGLIAAFSGGPDSTALLLALSRLGVPLTAAHLDHGMDPGSAGRAEAAARLAEGLKVPWIVERREVPGLRRRGESLEAAARRVRYAFLDEVRRAEGARWIATAHHRDDQAETVVLRLLFGSGLEGLGGIRPVHGAVVRPLLGVPRRDLLAFLNTAGLQAVEDPTNADLSTPRNRVRHRLIEALEAPSSLLARIADRSRAAGARLDRLFGRHLKVWEAQGGIALEREGLERLPADLQPFALAWLHRRAGAPYPAGAPARSELLRQIRGSGLGCDCGAGWRWESEGDLLVLRPAEAAQSEGVQDFTYTLRIPGEVEIPEIAARVALSRRSVEPWMLEGSSRRAALALPLAEGDCVTVRNRRPGDRIHPLGAAGSRKLKDVLIDRRVPKQGRERLPLVCVGERIAWVPGVTIAQRFRLPEDVEDDIATTAWIAEINEIER